MLRSVFARQFDHQEVAKVSADACDVRVSRVAIAVPSLYYGGGQRVAVLLANEIAERLGADVTIIVSYRGMSVEMTSAVSRDVRIEFLPDPSRNLFGCVLAYARHVLAKSYDVIHTHLSSFRYCMLGMLLQRNSRWIHTVHTVPQTEDPCRWQRLLKSGYYGRFTKPVLLTPRMRVKFRELYGFDRGEEVIPNGVPSVMVTEHSREAENELEQYRRSPHTRFLVTVSWLRHVKRFDIMVEAFQRLRASGADVVLLHIGNSEEWSDRKAELAAKGIFFLGPRPNVIDYLHYSHFFLLSSEIEALPVSMLEAMALGAVPVCTPAGGIPDVIDDGQTGFLAGGFTAEAFAEALSRAWSMPSEEYTAMSNRCRQLVESQFSVRRMADNYWRCYHGLPPDPFWKGNVRTEPRV